ncbi:HipA domain-containing protein [Mucilaginibacter mali]|uniref:HipA domain-containing protein n=1 Tax=Mucilaginibacter mali TaxID=2740462 RepID=A0A7D4UBT8_9SPHI|nr:HipA domain-containing protein [Mucilaginibacter mali]QKJ28499.1 HipA domain-containing protein [Mucilaginibacter mali]
MPVPEINTCPATLAPGYHTYSPVGLKRLFNGRKVSHVLIYSSPKVNEDDAEKFVENRKRLSISGVQEKLSFLLQKKTLRLTESGEQGTYILKPIPRDVKKVDQLPANEHLTMQIARQVYGINTAENGLVFFNSGEPVYITKRFDVKPDGSKWRKEDFASLGGKSKETAGLDFKYESSYEEIAVLIKRFVPAWRIEIEKYFSLVLFNFLFSNGDAHLKNFALLETEQGDFILSPAYDLLNTKIHVDDSDFAFQKGLFANGSKSVIWERTGHPIKDDFYRFGEVIGLAPKRIEALLLPFITRQEKVVELTANSYLQEPIKKAYIDHYYKKMNLLMR